MSQWRSKNFGNNIENYFDNIYSILIDKKIDSYRIL